MKSEIHKKLLEYNEDELVYKRYYETQNNPIERAKLIEEIGMEEIVRRNLMFSEREDDFSPPFEMGDGIFGNKNAHNICLSKHNRYTPEFLHSHSFFEMIYVLNGSCRNTVYGNTEILNEGSFCIISPHSTHSIEIFDDSIVLNILVRTSTFEERYCTLLKSENMLSSFLLDGIFSENHPSHLLFSLDNETKLKDIILEMYREQQCGDAYSEEVVKTDLVAEFNRCKIAVMLAADTIELALWQKCAPFFERRFFKSGFG